MRMLLPLVLSIALCATGCNRGGSPAEDTDPLVLRTYAVPADRTRQIAEALNTVLDAGENQRPIGRASLSVPGKVPVLAPLSMQASIAASIKELSGDAPAATASQTFRMRYWLVDAIHAAGDDDPQLAGTAPALDAVRTALGTAHFSLVDYGDTLLASNAGNGAIETGRGNRFHAVLRGTPGQLRAEIEVRQHVDGDVLALGTTMELVHDQLLVLTQTLSAPAGDAAPRSRLVIVQAQTVRPAPVD